MAVSREFQEYILERLECVGEVTAKKMFGGLGLYLGGIFFALAAENTLYFKVDDHNRPEFVKAGCKPFRPFTDKDYEMSYFEVPADVLEDDSLLRQWADKAFAAALNGKKKTSKKKQRKKL